MNRWWPFVVVTVLALVAAPVGTAEQPELDHARPLRRWRSRARHRDGDGPVTSW